MFTLRLSFLRYERWLITSMSNFDLDVRVMSLHDETAYQTVGAVATRTFTLRKGA